MYLTPAEKALATRRQREASMDPAELLAKRKAAAQKAQATKAFKVRSERAKRAWETRRRREEWGYYGSR